MFLISSRRRHTRFDCDWSSDVCSSDLAAHPPDGASAAAGRRVSATPKSPVLFSAGGGYPFWAGSCAWRTSSAWVNGNIGWLRLLASSFPSPRSRRLARSEEHTSELQSQSNLVFPLLP